MTSQWQLSGELAPREPNSVCGSWPLETCVTPGVTGRLELKLTFDIPTYIFLQCLVHLSLNTRMNIFVDDITHIHIPLTADVISTVNNSRSVFTHKRNLKKGWQELLSRLTSFVVETWYKPTSGKQDPSTSTLLWPLRWVWRHDDSRHLSSSLLFMAGAARWCSSRWGYK